jgi:long-chain acyl-CoA synthetase
VADESAGRAMLYSSGTTGRPKGVKRAGVVDPAIDAPNPLANLGQALYGWTPETVYLSPAPLYHAAPLGWSMAVQSMGGTVILMERFDAEDALRFIEQYKVTSAQWVPTHFVRMLKLPPEVRERCDVSSLKSVFHAAAPCPVPVKEQMIAWWGPIVHEYYAGTEGNGFCIINSQEWLAHKGSVGRGLMAQVRICDEDGDPLPPRTEGLVFFEGGGQFEYHGDPAKTAESRNKHGWTTLGDVGWLDEEGYLYLTDRKSFMIISGGVNIYPQELENVLIGHPKVADAAVVGAPDEEMGEKVVAVIQPMDWADAGDDLRAELMAYARAHLSHVKSPRVIDFMAELPRHATGKLYKRLIRDAYWGKEGARIG